MVTRNSQQLSLATVLLLAANFPAAADPPAQVDPNVIARGRELFLKVWAPNTGAEETGDGLGPVFNDTSCAACHNLGGIGGAGSNSQNVRVLSISAATNPNKRALIHPGFAAQTSVVLHHRGVDRHYEAWRKRHQSMAHHVSDAEEVPAQLQTAMKAYQQGLQRQATALANIAMTPDIFIVPQDPPSTRRIGWGMGAGSLADFEPAGTVTVSERNSTALFGAGLIDRIPESAIEAAAALETAQSPRTAGRVAKLPNKQIGRFGWHAQQASLTDFALTACAVELGLCVPGHPQAGNPLKPKYKAPGMDLTADQCAALVEFLAALPRPEEPQAAKPQVQNGRRLFERIGCADCHRQNLGDVIGLYSDLLLHDMGAGLKAGRYGAFIPEAAADQPVDQSWHGDLEWRTPPLWGVASSAPYLHDGRAATLREAILSHGGQAQDSADSFRNLPPADQQGVIVFLDSLAGPAVNGLTRVPEIKPGQRASHKPGRVATKAARRAGEKASFD